MSSMIGLFVPLALAAQAAAAGVLVNTSSGPVRGFYLDDFSVFRGIPYAAPPVGDLRWKPTQPHPGWAPKILNATDYGATCIQMPGGWNTINTTTLSEDCLFINVYAPRSPSPDGSGYPVMVYLHAGEFRFGSSNDAENDFPYFSKEVVLVTFNNRLGPLGYLGAEALRSRSPSGGTGNYGIEDQREAFRWVRRNIGSFGGDPKRVSIFGESSGGTCVGIHLTNPKSFGLFDRAILESPGLYQLKSLEHSEENYRYLLSSLASDSQRDCTFGDTKRYDSYPGTVFARQRPIDVKPSILSQADAEEACNSNGYCVAFSFDFEKKETVFYKQISGIYDVKSMGSDMASRHTTFVLAPNEDPQMQVECLMNADAEVLTALTSSLPHDDTFSTDGYAPVLDGVDMKYSIIEAIDRDILAPVSILFGSNLDEATEFMALCPPIRCNASRDTFEEWAQQLYGDVSQKIVDLYSNNLTLPWPVCQERHWPGSPQSASGLNDFANAKWYTAAMRSATDFGLLCPLRRLARHASKNESRPLYGYHFSHTPIYSANFQNMSYMGACHGCEVPFVFGDAFEIKSDDEAKLSKRMGCYWRNFAMSGDPNSGSCEVELPRWPKYVYDDRGEHNEGLLKLDLGDDLQTLYQLNADRCDAFDASNHYQSS